MSNGFLSILPQQVVHADVAPPPAAVAVVSLGVLVVLGIIVAIVVVGSILVIRAIRKSHARKDNA